MRFHSTASADERITASEAMIRGLAPDGRLYIPERMPTHDPASFEGLEGLEEIGAHLLKPFFEGDVLEGALAAICEDAFTFPTPLRTLDETTHVLELFHGPTSAFKDVGARFLATALSHLVREDEDPFTILVATSGDTGGAVAAAFYKKPGTRVHVLYPKGKVSPRQEHQLTCWGENVSTFAVEGDFDACQRMVKGAFADPWWQQHRRLTSANSINIGRLLPQAAYYAYASLHHWRRTGRAPGFIIPSGNVGNVSACLWAKRCGLPISTIHLATNANRPLADYAEGAPWTPRPSVQTLATAMDVGAPSNIERLFALLPTPDAFNEALRVTSVSDAQIEQAIIDRFERHGQAWCPHTACAAHVQTHVLDEAPDQIIVSTAHASKFDTIVEPLIGQPVAMPPRLAALMKRPTHAQVISPTLDALTEAIRGG